MTRPSVHARETILQGSPKPEKEPIGPSMFPGIFSRIYSIIQEAFLDTYHLSVAIFQFLLGYTVVSELFRGGRSFTAKAIPDQTGKVFLITGGTREHTGILISVFH